MNQLSQVIRSISTDELTVSAHVDKAKEIGQIFVGSMTGKVVTEVPLKKKDQVKTMTLTNKIKISEDNISIDPLCCSKDDLGKPTIQSCQNIFFIMNLQLPLLLFLTHLI